ncbi:MAG: helix-turn-helix transcriptional regulator [Deltaproteobacteria bacterium]|nr:helix-turn-helix transcriptional regulator [Deltaproteobacteria bacterium]
MRYVYFASVIPKNPETFLKSALMLEGITLTALSAMTGVTMQYLSMMLGGHKKMSAEVFEKICCILRIVPGKVREQWPYAFDGGNLLARKDRAIQ